MQTDLAPTFEHRSLIRTTMEAMYAFHESPNAFQRLTPPPVFVQVHRKDLRTLNDGEVAFTLWFLFIPTQWEVKHIEGVIPTGFTDYAIKSPLAVWRHNHIFEQQADGILLIDRITIQHERGIKGILTRLVFGNIPLHILFAYRHLRTRIGVKQYE